MALASGRHGQISGRIDRAADAAGERQPAAAAQRFADGVQNAGAVCVRPEGSDRRDPLPVLQVHRRAEAVLRPAHRGKFLPQSGFDAPLLLGEIRLHKMNGIVKAEHQDAQAEAAPAGKQRTVFLYDGFESPPANTPSRYSRYWDSSQLAVALHSGCQRSLLLHEVFKNMREPGNLIRFLRGRHAAQLGGALYQYGKRAGGILCQHIRKAEARHRDESCQQHKAENSCERRLIILPEIQGLHHLDTVILQLVAKYGLAGKAFRPTAAARAAVISLP